MITFKMDDLPKKQSDDLSSYMGAYPQEPQGSSGASTTPPTTPVKSDAPPLTPTSPSPSPSPTPTTPTTPTSPATFTSTDPFSSVVPSGSNPPPAATPGFDAGQPPASVWPATSEPASPVPPADNPFTYQAEQQPVQTGGKGIKRVITIIIILVILAVIGYLAFNFIGKLLLARQPIVLNYWGLWENEQILTPLIEEYQKTHPSIQIAYTKQSPRQYRERLQAAIGRGEGPDMFRFHATWVPMFKEELAAAGKTGYTTQEFQQAFYPVAAEDLIINGGVYGVPLMIDGLGLYYNEDLLRSAGVTPPTNWEEFRQAALTLTVKDQTGKIITSGAALGTTSNVEHFSDILATMLLQNGADLNNPISQEAEQALSFYRLFAEGPTKVWDDTLDNSILAFANGKVAFIFAPSWEVFTILETNPQLKFQIVPIPQLPGTNVTWASYWAEGVSKKSTHQDEAWEFLKFLSQKDTLTSLYSEESKIRAFGEPYSRIDLAETIANDPYAGVYVRQAPTARSFFLASRTFDNGMNDRMIKYAEDAVNSQGLGVSAQSALQTMAQGFNQVMSSFGSSAPSTQQ